MLLRIIFNLGLLGGPFPGPLIAPLGCMLAGEALWESIVGVEDNGMAAPDDDWVVMRDSFPNSWKVISFFSAATMSSTIISDGTTSDETP